MAAVYGVDAPDVSSSSRNSWSSSGHNNSFLKIWWECKLGGESSKAKKVNKKPGNKPAIEIHDTVFANQTDLGYNQST